MLFFSVLIKPCKADVFFLELRETAFHSRVTRSSQQNQVNAWKFIVSDPLVTRTNSYFSDMLPIKQLSTLPFICLWTYASEAPKNNDNFQFSEVPDIFQSFTYLRKEEPAIAAYIARHRDYAKQFKESAKRIMAVAR